MWSYFCAVTKRTISAKRPLNKKELKMGYHIFQYKPRISIRYYNLTPETVLGMTQCGLEFDLQEYYP